MTCYLNYTRIKRFVNQLLRFLPMYLYSGLMYQSSLGTISWSICTSSILSSRVVSPTDYSLGTISWSICTPSIAVSIPTSPELGTVTSSFWLTGWQASLVFVRNTKLSISSSESSSSSSVTSPSSHTFHDLSFLHTLYCITLIRCAVHVIIFRLILIFVLMFNQ